MALRAPETLDVRTEAVCLRMCPSGNFESELAFASVLPVGLCSLRGVPWLLWYRYALTVLDPRTRTGTY